MSDDHNFIQDIRQEVSHLGLQAHESLAEFIKRLHAGIPATANPWWQPTTKLPETPPTPPPQA